MAGYATINNEIACHVCCDDLLWINTFHKRYKVFSSDHSSCISLIIYSLFQMNSLKICLWFWHRVALQEQIRIPEFQWSGGDLWTAHRPLAYTRIPLRKCHFQEANFSPSHTDTCRRQVKGSKNCAPATRYLWHNWRLLGMKEEWIEGVVFQERDETWKHGDLNEKNANEELTDWELVLKWTTIILWTAVVFRHR